MCVHACKLSHVQLFVTPWTSSVHEVIQPRIPEWVAISSSREFSWSRDQTHVSFVSCIWWLILYHWAICISEVIEISPSNLDSSCASSSPAFLMIYSAYKLNKQGDNMHPRRTPFPVWNQSFVPCPVLTVASWPAYRFLKRQASPVSYSNKSLIYKSAAHLILFCAET